jgi:hypothetical protein
MKKGCSEIYADKMARTQMASDSPDTLSRTEERELRTADGDSEKLLLTALGKGL